MTDIDKKINLFMIMPILLIFVLLLDFTFALFNKKVDTNKTITLKSGTKYIGIYGDNKNNVELGKTYSFTIENRGQDDAGYNLYLTDINKIDLSNIMYKYTKNGRDISKTMNESIDNRIIDSGSLLPGESITINLIISSSTNMEKYLGKLYLKTVDYILPTAPLITGGSNLWSTSSKTINIVKNGETYSTGGLKNYEYLVTDEDITPNINTIVTGTTTDSISVTDDGIKSIYYRTVDSNNYKSAWSLKEISKKDSQAVNSIILDSVNKSGNEVLTLTAKNTETASGYTYQWYKDGAAISNATSSKYNVTTSGTYSLKQTNGAGVSNTSANYTLSTLSSTTYNSKSALTLIGRNYQNNTCIAKAKYYTDIRSYMYNSSTCTASYANNLFENGYLEYGNNKNASYFTYNASTNELSYNGSVQNNFGNYIPVDPNKTYIQTLSVKSSNSSAFNYFGIAEFDIDYNPIVASMIMFITGSTTYLTKDLNPGDTTVYLNSTNGFNTSSSIPYYQKGFIFWNYKDSTGYTYTKETYSRNVYYNLFEYNNVNKTNNTIKLNSAWTGSLIKSGTYLSQSNDGGTYNYGLLSAGYLTSNYTTLTNTIHGTAYNNSSASAFRAGTKYIKMLGLFNYNGQPNTISYVKSYSFKEQ